MPCDAERCTSTTPPSSLKRPHGSSRNTHPHHILLPPTASMSHDLDSLVRQLDHNISHNDHSTSASLLTRAKLALLRQHALLPTPSTPAPLLQTAQHVLETGALISIRLQDAAAFTRYFQQLQPFYALTTSKHAAHPKHKSERSKITGLYLLLLLSQGDYAGFHTQLESLEAVAEEQGSSLDDDAFVQYPVRLEQWLMEGSYDRMWAGTRSDQVPSEEFAIFSNVSEVSCLRVVVFGCTDSVVL